MDMRRGSSWRVTLSLEVVERNVIADHICVDVDVVVELACRACQASSEFCSIDDLVWSSFDEVHGTEGKQLVGTCTCEGVCAVECVLVEISSGAADAQSTRLAMGNTVEVFILGIIKLFNESMQYKFRCEMNDWE